MGKSYRWRTILFTLFLTASIDVAQADSFSVNQEKTSPANPIWNTLPVETIQQDPIEGAIAKTKFVHYPNGDLYWMKQIQFHNQDGKRFPFTVPIQGKKGTFKYLAINKEGNKEWKTIPLQGVLPKASGFIDTSTSHWYISYPTLFEPYQYSTLKEDTRSLPVSIKQTKTGYILEMKFIRDPGKYSEMWAIQSDKPLVDWSNPVMESIWKYLDMSYDGKWTWNGDYESPPDNSYLPHGEHIFWRFPDNYIARSCINTGHSRLSDDLGWVMLNDVLPDQNDKGYWETSPQSNWLWQEYKIGHGFYDTRFNTDFAKLLLHGYANYGDPGFLNAAQKYDQWYKSFAQKEHTTVKGIAGTGWLVPDYTSDLPHKKVHTSMNHQLAEINFLFAYYLRTGDEDSKELALTLIRGIINTKAAWLKPNGDLYYSLLNGKGIGVDYPTLTYNDLWETQSLLLKIRGKVNSDLMELMANKKKWMDAHAISSYITKKIEEAH
jgi:hypothetical protein